MSDSTQLKMLIDAMARDFYRSINPVTIQNDDENLYEFACRRMENATTAGRIMRRMVKQLDILANDEYDSAVANLREHEESPGICKAEYRNSWPHLDPNSFERQLEGY